MKNVLKTMMVVGVFALFAFAPVNVKKAIVTPNEEVACVEAMSSEWFTVCCTVSNGQDVVLVCRTDNNLRKACRIARRAL